MTRRPVTGDRQLRSPATLSTGFPKEAGGMLSRSQPNNRKHHRRTRRGVGGDGCTPGLKNIRANSFFRASASCSKILNDKKYIQYSEKFKGNSVFQGKGTLLKNPE